MDSSPSGSGDGSVRRRHSSQSHSNPYSERSEQEQERRSTHHEVARPSTDSTHRVRFSADVLRRSSKKRNSDEHLSAFEDNDAGERARPALQVDTEAAQNAGEYHNVLGETLFRSPTYTEEPASSSQQDTVTTPRSRARGLSLRSSLFMRKMNNTVTSPGSIIEMHDFPNSSNDAPLGRSATKKDPESTVHEVAPDDFEHVDLHQLPAYKAMRASAELPAYQKWAGEKARKHLPLAAIKASYERTRKFMLRIHELSPSKNGRQIAYDAYRKQALVDERRGGPYISNIIRSSKYTPVNFIPRQLFAQFSKLANFYFLIISIMQMIPGLSTTGNYTTIIPLFFFVSISIAKEGYEDLRRHRLDKAENTRQVNVLHAYKPVITTDEAERALQIDGPIHWSRIKWQALQVGDIIKLERDEAIPADIVLLRSNGPNNVAYVETMALDGETNLKNKQPLPATVTAVGTTLESLAAAQMHFTVEDPNLDLYNFEGKVTVGDETFPLTNNEVLYRGSVLRNTPEAVGIVIYSGEECKIRMNANKSPRIKAPSLQSRVNRIVLLVVGIVIFLAAFNASAYGIWRKQSGQHMWYIHRAHVPGLHIVTGFIIMFNTMIPLSLYVSMEIIKVVQMLLLNDIDMYDPETNTPFEARTSTINEELGQISYIFSDKTGTLTENIMRFRKLSVAGAAWLHDADLQMQKPAEQLLLHKKRGLRGKGKEPASSRISRDVPRSSRPSMGRDESPASISRAATWKSSAMPEMAQTDLNTIDLIHYIQHRPETVFAQKAKLMLLSMAVCHTCLPERHGDDDEKITYQASSPDELALVEAAKEMGFIAFSRESATLTLKLLPHGAEGEPVFENYQILDMIDFSSKRKRMSVVVRFPDQRVSVICKGADSMIMERLRSAKAASRALAQIEKRAMQRKSMEAGEALRRKSTQVERKGSSARLPRTSVALSRNSTSASRRSIGKIGSTTRDQVDTWLNEREHDVVVSPVTSSFPRQSMAHSERRRSMHADLADDIADAAIEEAMTQDETVELERCLQHITDFATEGLRTLLYGYRFLDEEEYRAWKKVYHDATTSLVDRQKLIESAGELIEQRLELGGATAIEDKLQKGVPETIDRLRRANIRMWMLTGDKRETAINIGHSCGLIKDYSSVTVIDHEAGDLEQAIARAIVDIDSGTIAHSVVVVDGQTLTKIETHPLMQNLFIGLAILADSVICCRASPSQKAGLVNAIRERVPGSVTLAIGDGANDIAMIQEAHVGIGITGKEGLQAARTSDYAIAQFRFLAKLLLVHGRWNYIRTCKYTLGTFWKEFTFFVTMAFYQHYTGYTGTSLYEPWSLSMFNTLFTSLIVIMLGIFEQDLRAATLIAVPELYTKGQRSNGFNLRIYTGWMFMGLVDAAIIFFSMERLFAASQRLAGVAGIGMFPMGDLSFTACIILIAVKLQVIEQRYKSIMAVVAIGASVGGWFLWNIILAAVYRKNDIYDVKGGFFYRFGRNPLWWCVLLLSVAATVLFELAVRTLKTAFFPTDVETFQALEQDLEIRKRFEEASAPWMQEGWSSSTKKSSLEIRREEAAQIAREDEVQQLLNKRPRDLESGLARSSTSSSTDEPSASTSTNHRNRRDNKADGHVLTTILSASITDSQNQQPNEEQLDDRLARQFGRVQPE